MRDPTLQLAMDLIARPSVTPEDAGCQDLIAARLAPLGFDIEPMPFGDVRNLWARRGSGSPLVVLAGHTDVVPPGPREAWASDPFVPTLREGRLYGRGAADMKSSVAAFVTAIEDLLGEGEAPAGSIGVLLTSDEEGPALDGTVKVVEALQTRGEHIDYCIVGEPSSEDATGDTIKNGRRGSLGAHLLIKGKQGHVAYPHLARNPVHDFAPVLAELVIAEWDRGNSHFPATTFQVSNIHAGTGAENVIPGTLEVDFNFRFSTEVEPEALQRRVEALLARHGVDYEIHWTLAGRPFLTPEGRLVDAVRAAVAQHTGRRPVLSTGGGTSDGRFIAPTGAQVVELGPPNRTIHQVNECVDAGDPALLSRIYRDCLRRLLSAD